MQLTIRQTRRPGSLARGQVSIACASGHAGPTGVSPSVYDRFGKIIAEMLPGRQRRRGLLAVSPLQLEKRPKLKVEPRE